MKSIWRWLDGAAERRVRGLAQQTARRSLLVGIGRSLMVTAFTLPVLPFDRTSQAHAQGAHGASARKKGAATETDCDYWRYCSVDGFLCSCCGGSATSCPPGSTASKVAWVGAVAPVGVVSAIQITVIVLVIAWVFITTSIGAWPMTALCTTARCRSLLGWPTDGRVAIPQQARALAGLAGHGAEPRLLQRPRCERESFFPTLRGLPWRQRARCGWSCACLGGALETGAGPGLGT